MKTWNHQSQELMFSWAPKQGSWKDLWRVEQQRKKKRRERHSYGHRREHKVGRAREGERKISQEGGGGQERTGGYTYFMQGRSRMAVAPRIPTYIAGTEHVIFSHQLDIAWGVGNKQGGTNPHFFVPLRVVLYRTSKINGSSRSHAIPFAGVNMTID